MKRFALFFGAFFCGTFVLMAQVLMTGRITDAEDGRPVQGAHIVSQSRAGIGSASNEEGVFRIELEPNERVRISFLGYRDTVVSCGASSCHVLIRLVPENQMLEQFVVTASKGREAIKDLTISMESVKPYLAENKNIVSLEKLAEQIPGVQIVDNQANIRAGSGWTYGAGSRVMVLVDGMPMMSGDAGQVLWNFMPIDHLANTEVIKGAASVLFGSSALNGVIHVRTARPGNQPYTRISTYAGRFAAVPQPGLAWRENQPLFYGINAAHARKMGKHELTLSLNHNADQGYRMGTPDNRKRAGLRYRYALNERLQLGFNSAAMSNESGSFLLWQSLDSGYTAYNREVTLTRSTRFHADPWMEYQGKKHSHALRIRYLAINNEVDNGDPTNDQSNASDYWYADYMWTRKGKRDGIHLTAGSTAGWVESRSPLYMGDQNASNVALYFQADQKWRKWKWNAGGRWERYTLNEFVESRPIFRAGLNYELHKTGYLRASWGQGYRFPTIAEQYISTTVGPMTIYPNPELGSESGWNAEIGYKQAFRLGNFRGFADLSLFRMEFNNMIEFNFNQWRAPSLSDFGIGFKALNVGPARVDGIEFSLSGEASWLGGKWTFLSGCMLSRPVTLDPNYTAGFNVYNEAVRYNNSSSDTSGNILKYRSRNQVRADVQYARGRFTAGLSYRYNSAIENIDLAFISVPLNLFIKDIDKGLNQHPGGMHYTDIRLQYQVKKQWVTGIVINNMFNRIYMLRPADLQPPRSVQVTLSYEI